MPSVCTFELNKPNATYFSGETISGAIILNTNNSKSVREVCIIFLGEGKVKWSESHSTTNSDGRSSSNTTHFSSHETYINSSTRVHGDGELAVGTYRYTFNIPLPWECPTSCEGKYGHIRYEISLKINRYFRFDNVYKQAVTVLKTVDLNLYPHFKLPIVLETLSSSCCWPCARGKIFCTLRIPYGAYAPGQIVKYSLHIVNQSMDDTEGYYLEFLQKITFTAKSPHRKERHTKIALVRNSFPDKCLRLSNRILDGGFLIPAIPSSTERSEIICVEYILKITLQASCCRSNPDLVVPIVIGTIPIRESLPPIQLLESNEQQELLPTAPEMPGNENQIVDLPPDYNEIKPPTFVEATRSTSPFVDPDTDARNRLVDFRPLYPMYNTPYPEK